LSIPLSGGRSSSKHPSSRRANHSKNVVCSMPVCSRAACVNKNRRYPGSGAGISVIWTR
jgi:hypothetical protein